MTIWKYPLEITRSQCIEVPSDSRALSAALQNGDLCVWFLVEESRPKQTRRILIYGTGNPIGGVFAGWFIGSVQQGPFVWHVFDAGLAS